VPGGHVEGRRAAAIDGRRAVSARKNLGYDQTSVWVSDGCSAEFGTGPPGEPETTKPKPLSHIPNVGFLLFDGDKGQVYFRLFSYAVFDMWAPVWRLLTPEASLTVRKGNYERIFNEGRRRARAWEKANVR
jgi:hypothetical protein